MPRLPWQRSASLMLKTCLVAAAAAGQIASGSGFLSMNRMQYYTNLSNVWTLGLSLVMIGWELGDALRPGQGPAPRSLLTARYALTAGVLVTFLVFNALLAPNMIREGRARYLWGLSNAMVHNAVPLLAVIDFLLFRYGYRPGRRAWAWGLLMPFLYLVFVAALSMSGYRFSGNRVPYFFMDYTANGWFTLRGGIGTFWWLLFILLFTAAMSRTLLSVHNMLEVRSLQREGMATLPDAKEET